MDKTPAPRAALDRPAWIKAAIAALAEGGRDRLRVELLAQRLGVTKGSFYWHFRDRRDLFDAVLQQWKEGRIGDILRQTAAEPGREREQILHVIDVYAANRNRKGIPIELAVRDWARHDTAAAAAVAEVDATRLQCAARLFVACGLPADEAAARSALLYAYVFGISLLSPQSLGAHAGASKRRIAEWVAGMPA
jgi:AcrR family transcriptional regulator